MPSYGLPGTAAEIHLIDRGMFNDAGYGLPGTAAEIHSIGQSIGSILTAMVCREPLLRYT